VVLLLLLLVSIDLFEPFEAFQDRLDVVDQTQNLMQRLYLECGPLANQLERGMHFQSSNIPTELWSSASSGHFAMVLLRIVGMGRGLGAIWHV
jgi:hypothetical protein